MQMHARGRDGDVCPDTVFSSKWWLKQTVKMCRFIMPENITALCGRDWVLQDGWRIILVEVFGSLSEPSDT